MAVQEKGGEMMEKKVKRLKDGTLKLTISVSKKEIEQFKKMDLLQIVPQIMAASIMAEILKKKKTIKKVAKK